jgi:hypothetical protein
MLLGHVAEFYECFDTDTNHLGRLTKLKQSSTMEDFIASFERLSFRTEGMSDAFFRECFISGLKDEIRAHVVMPRLRVGWRLLKELRKHNRLYVLKKINPPLFLTLNQ